MTMIMMVMMIKRAHALRSIMAAAYGDELALEKGQHLLTLLWQ